jgi:hypothetical protein
MNRLSYVGYYFNSIVEGIASDLLRGPEHNTSSLLAQVLLHLDKTVVAPLKPELVVKFSDRGELKHTLRKPPSPLLVTSPSLNQ